jgi:hypothetical protein
MSALEDFAGRLRGLVISLADFLDPADIELVHHLIDHDEGGEALLTLSWIIVEKNKHVPSDALVAIRELSEGLVDPVDMPPGLDKHAIKDE